ncbi:MAG: hypothetical protein Kilf2KO_31930 [Rhodospirillales bacterium]
MTRSFRLTPRALVDLDSIASYRLVKWGEAQGEAYLDSLFDRLHWLAE